MALALANILPSHNRLVFYGMVSTAFAAGVVLNVAGTRPGFYSAAVAIARSNGAVMILANFCLFLTILMAIALQRVFFGPLRAIEVEHLYDRSWYFLTESLLALTMFREDFDVIFILLFVFLLFLKTFHWIAADRVDWMDQLPPPGPPFSFHLRMMALFGFLFFADTLLLGVAVQSLYAKGLNGKILFVSEYILLLTSLGNIVAKYGVNLWERYREWRESRARAAAARLAEQNGEEPELDDEDRGWESKSMVVFYIDLVTDFLKLLTYLAFFVVVLIDKGLPFNILRDVYLTLRSFLGRIRTLVQYRAATRNMDARYPDATREEMDAMEDKVCIICREEMSYVERDPAVAAAAAAANSADGTVPPAPPPRRRQPREGDRPKKLSCNHVFHLSCLKSWLERQQNCPTCRRTVLQPTPSVIDTNPAIPGIGGPAPGVAAQPGGPAAQRFAFPNARAGLAAGRAAANAMLDARENDADAPPGAAGGDGGGAGDGGGGGAGGGADAGDEGGGGGIWGRPAPPARFNPLPLPFPQLAPVHPPGPAPVVAGRGLGVGAGFELNFLGLEIRFRIGAGPDDPAARVYAAGVRGLQAPAAPGVAPAPARALPAQGLFRPGPRWPLPTPAPAPDQNAVAPPPAVIPTPAPPAPTPTRTVPQVDNDAPVAAVTAATSSISPPGASISSEAVSTVPQLVVPPSDSVSTELEALSTAPSPEPETEAMEESAIDISNFTPREVAAQAALRRSTRLAPQSSSLSLVPTSPTIANNSPSPTKIEPTLTAPSGPGSTSNANVVQAVPAVAPTPFVASSTSKPPVEDSEVPATPPATVPQSLPLRQPTLTPLYTPTFDTSRPLLPFPHPQPFAVPPRLPSPTRTSSASSFPPLPSLPLPTELSDDQLRAMDALTREAIEERLCFIERIDGVLGALRLDLRRASDALWTPPTAARARVASPARGGEVQAAATSLKPAEVPLPRSPATEE